MQKIELQKVHTMLEAVADHSEQVWHSWFCIYMDPMLQPLKLLVSAQTGLKHIP